MYKIGKILAGAALRHWKVIAFFAIIAAVALYSYRAGVNHTQAKWDADIAAQQKLWAEKSKEYQVELAKSKAKINAKRKEVQDAIRNSYAGCIAGDDIVRLWHDSFGDASR